MAKKTEGLICTSCGGNITTNENFVQFLCPACGKIEILRCSNCKQTSNTYICKGCKFEGP